MFMGDHAQDNRDFILSPKKRSATGGNILRYASVSTVDEIGSAHYAAATSLRNRTNIDTRISRNVMQHTSWNI